MQPENLETITERTFKRVDSITDFPRAGNEDEHVSRIRRSLQQMLDGFQNHLGSVGTVPLPPE